MISVIEKKLIDNVINLADLFHCCSLISILNATGYSTFSMLRLVPNTTSLRRDFILRHCFVALRRCNNGQEKYKLLTKCTSLVANFEESFRGVIAELLTK